MLFSCFAKFGHLRFSAKPARGQAIYNALAGALGGQYATTIGSRAEAWRYATAMLLARAEYTVERAQNQLTPSTALELLPVLEAKYGVIPGLNDTIATRETTLATKIGRARGATSGAITSNLTAALGADFISYYTVPSSGVSAGATTRGNWTSQGLPARVVLLTGPVANTGSATVGYASADSTDPVTLTAGDVLLVSANNPGLAEPVTLTAATSSAFTAVFSGAHDPGDVCTTGSYPLWPSNNRHAIVVVSESAAGNAEKRRLVNDVMTLSARGVSTWDITPTYYQDVSSGRLTDVLTVGDALLGQVGFAGLGAVTF